LFSGVSYGKVKPRSKQSQIKSHISVQFITKDKKIFFVAAESSKGYAFSVNNTIISNKSTLQSSGNNVKSVFLSELLTKPP
jgi:hypothetical protein